MCINDLFLIHSEYILMSGNNLKFFHLDGAAVKVHVLAHLILQLEALAYLYRCLFYFGKPHWQHI